MKTCRSFLSRFAGFVRMTRAVQVGRGEPGPGGTKSCHEKHISYRPALVPLFIDTRCHVDDQREETPASSPWKGEKTFDKLF